MPATVPLINAALIPEGQPARRDPPALAPLFAANDALGRLRVLPGAVRPAAPALRLLPLGGFAWAGPRGLPRTRGDHVLFWITAGGASLRLPCATSEVTAGGLLFLPAGTAFALTAAEGAEGVALLLPRDLAARAAPTFPARPVSATLDTAAATALHAELMALLTEAGGTDAEARRALGLRLGLLALRLGRLAALPRAGAVPDPLAERFVTLAARELGRGRTIGEMAETLGCTAAALDRACRAVHGQPALGVLAKLRLTRAQDLLRATDRPLAAIAREAGFTGRAHLSRALIAATGCPPEAFRQR